MAPPKVAQRSRLYRRDTQHHTVVRVEAPRPYHLIPKAATVDVLFSQTESLETTTPRTSL